MHSWTRRTVGLALALALGGCGSTTTSSPTTGSNTTDVAPALTDTLVFTSDIYAASPNGLREVFSLNSNTPGTPTRLTFSNETAPTNNLEASSAPSRTALAVRRVPADSNGDGLLNESDNAEIVVVAYASPITETVYVPASVGVTGVDFSPAGTDIAYSAPGTGGTSDLWDIASDGSSNSDVTNTPAISERRPRFDATGSILSMEYLSSGLQNSVYIYDSSGNEDPVDFGTTRGSPLPGTPYMVGGDADPVFSPAGNTIVFRRLTGIPNAQGTWDVLTTNGTSSTTLVTGPLYRGAPDWGSNGILFVETDPALGISSIVLVAPDGSGRRVLYSAPPGYTVANPRWLR